MSTWNMIHFQNSSSPLMEQLIFFHDHTMIIIILITILVMYMMVTLLMSNLPNRYIHESQEIETVWTILPAIMLIFIALPSLRLLYLIDEMSEPSITIKTIGHQWYWSYEYSDFSNVEFDSYLVDQNNTPMNSFRLLDVDNRTMVPMNTQIRMIITATDVLHSWTVPSLGIKADAVPGRLNQMSFYINRPGLYFGQCSEICGANHSFMPITIESLNMNDFMNWIKKF